MVVAGDVNLEEIKSLSTKWFSNIEARDVPKRNLPKEPRQEEARTLSVERDVPVDILYKVFHMCSRKDERYFATDLMSDVLSRGNSSRLYESLVMGQKLFSDIDAFIGGDLDAGLFYFGGKLSKGVSMEEAEAGINLEIEKLKTELVSDAELTKVKNKVISAHMFSELNVLNKAINLATSELLGDPNLVNMQLDLYNAVSSENIRAIAKDIFRSENSNTLYYNAK